MAEADHSYRDALPDGPVRGRGAGLNPGNRFEAVRLHVLGEHLDEVVRQRDSSDEAAPSENVDTQVLPDRSRSLINYVDPDKSPDIPFRWTLNPYRGCEHGCVYCYARPTHEFLGLSSGLDFERKILAKFDAPALLRKELSAPKWRGEPIVMSGVTDCYQPIERELELTRRCLEVMVECNQPVGIVTKNRMVERDVDLLSQLAAHDAVGVTLSITSLDNELAHRMEPRASSPRDRLAAVRSLSAAGVPVRVMVAPIVPGLNDREVPAILEAAAEAGACEAGYVLLRLPHQVKALFIDWLARHYPDRAQRVESLIRQSRGGALYDATPGVRRRGQGAVAQQIGNVFQVFARRYGLNRGYRPISSAAFRKPQPGGQGLLF